MSGIYTFWVGVITLEWAVVMGLVGYWAIWKAGHGTRDVGTQQLPPSRQVANVGFLGFKSGVLLLSRVCPSFAFGVRIVDVI